MRNQLDVFLMYCDRGHFYEFSRSLRADWYGQGDEFYEFLSTTSGGSETLPYAQFQPPLVIFQVWPSEELNPSYPDYYSDMASLGFYASIRDSSSIGENYDQWQNKLQLCREGVLPKNIMELLYNFDSIRRRVGVSFVPADVLHRAQRYLIAGSMLRPDFIENQDELHRVAMPADSFRLLRKIGKPSETGPFDVAVDDLLLHPYYEKQAKNCLKPMYTR
jgi:hypothetical protein